MICAKNYEKLSKSVKVTPKILSVPFFQTRCTYRYLLHSIKLASIVARKLAEKL